MRRGQGGPEAGALPPAPLCPLPPRPPGLEVRRRRGTHHGEGFPGLLEQRLGEQGDVHALGDVHRPAVQVCDNNVQLQGGTGMRGGHGELTGKEPEREEALGNPSSSPLRLLQAQSTLAFSSNFPLPTVTAPRYLHYNGWNRIPAVPAPRCTEPTATAPREQREAGSEGAAGEESWQKREEEGRSPAREAGSPILALWDQTPQLAERSHGEHRHRRQPQLVHRPA